MRISAIVSIAILCLALGCEAVFDFGKIIGAVANTVGGVAGLINNILGSGSGRLLDVQITCSEISFKSRVVATNSLCQQVDNIGAIEACQYFGADCISRPGTWGCGTFDITRERGCLFKPSVKYPGERLPSITFDRGVEDFDQSRSRNQCAFGRRTSRPPRTLVLQGEDSEPDVPYKGLSDMYGQTLVANLKRFNASWIPEEEEMMASNDPVLALTVVLKALDVAGIRYPIGRYTCQFCKGTCNKLFSGSNLDTCKYKACVGFLGGYKGTETNPSCDLIPMP